MKTCRKEGKKSSFRVQAVASLHSQRRESHTPMLCAHFPLHAKLEKVLLEERCCGSIPTAAVVVPPDADLVCLIAAWLMTRVIYASQKNGFHSIRDYFCWDFN